MKITRCFFCYKELTADELETVTGKAGFHTKCSKNFFNTVPPPVLPYSEDDMLELGEQVIKSRKIVTGVQPKLSMGIEKVPGKDVPDRFTIIGLWGDFILKPPNKLYPNLPEIEDVTMHLAEISKIQTVKHSLIRLASGQLSYITKRVDRVKDKKLHMEDMCQLTEKLTEQKYKGSYEQIAKVILKYSTNPGLDVLNFYEIVLFSFLTGNKDMHLKNFSLLKNEDKNYNLCPAYDLVASELVVEGDEEELALNLNGKKRKIKREDFIIAMGISGIGEKAIDNSFKRFERLLQHWKDFIVISFMPDKLKEDYSIMVESKMKQLSLI
jgi:serine/threonine-protein kinase HipA